MQKIMKKYRTAVILLCIQLTVRCTLFLRKKKYLKKEQVDLLASYECDGGWREIRRDRSGSAMRDMALKGSFCAYEANITYCGMCGESEHMDTHRRLIDALGLSEILPIAEKCPEHKMRIIDCNVRSKTQTSKFVEWRKNLTETAQAHAQKEIAKRTGGLKDECLIVAHVRRGDLDPRYAPQSVAKKCLPNSYFLPLIEQAQSRYPKDCRVIVYTEKSTGFNRSQVVEPLEGNKDFYDRNYTVVVGGDEVAAWIDFVRADEFIGSKSSFSEFPAIFAQGNVQLPAHRGNICPMPDWTMLSTDKNCGKWTNGTRKAEP